MATILHELVSKAIKELEIIAEEMECDPSFADTAAFCEKYGFEPEQSANTILVMSRKVEPTRFAVCVVLASTRLDVNKMVTKLLCVKRASFADGETTQKLTGMEIGGVTAIGIKDLPAYIDAAVVEQTKIVMGGGNRTSKLALNPEELYKLPSAEIIENLAKPVT